MMNAANVSTIYKKADSLNKGNHRPGNVLTTVSQLYHSESAMNDQMGQHFIQIFDDLIIINQVSGRLEGRPWSERNCRLYIYRSL